MSEGVHKVYLLLSNDSLTCDASTVAADILRNIKIQTNQ
jgi:hypothetical protein